MDRKTDGQTKSRDGQRQDRMVRRDEFVHFKLNHLRSSKGSEVCLHNCWVQTALTETVRFSFPLTNALMRLPRRPKNTAE